MRSNPRNARGGAFVNMVQNGKGGAGERGADVRQVLMVRSLFELDEIYRKKLGERGRERERGERERVGERGRGRGEEREMERRGKWRERGGSACCLNWMKSRTGGEGKGRKVKEVIINKKIHLWPQKQFIKVCHKIIYLFIYLFTKKCVIMGCEDCKKKLIGRREEGEKGKGGKGGEAKRGDGRSTSRSATAEFTTPFHKSRIGL